MEMDGKLKMLANPDRGGALQMHKSLINIGGDFGLKYKAKENSVLKCGPAAPFLSKRIVS